MRLPASLAALLVAASALWADPPRVEPPELTVPVNEFETFTVKFDPKAKLLLDLGFRGQDCNVVRLHTEEAGVASFMVRPRKPGEYHLIFRNRGEDESSRVIVSTAGKAPVVPTPTPTPTPPPTPDALLPGEKVWGFVLVEETAEAQAGRGKLVASKPVWDFLRSAGWKWRIVDDDARDEAGATPAWLKPYLAEARDRGVPRMWVVVAASGRVVWSGTPPESPEEFLKLLKRFHR